MRNRVGIAPCVAVVLLGFSVCGFVCAAPSTMRSLRQEADAQSFGPCVAGAPVPTLEGSLAPVSFEPVPEEAALEVPGLENAQTKRPFGVGYPHRQRELLVFPKAKGVESAEERGQWESTFEQVGAKVIRFDPAVPMYVIRFEDPDIEHPDIELGNVAAKLEELGANRVDSIYANSCVFTQMFSPQYPDFSCDAAREEQWALNTIRIREAWGIERGERGVVVGVIDSGFDHANPDLKSFWNNPCYTETGRIPNCHPADTRIGDRHGWDFYSNRPPLEDNATHGTMIAGIIGAEINGFGIDGINGKPAMMDLRVYDTMAETGSLDRLMSAISYAVDYGAQVINMSFTTDAASPLRAAIQNAKEVLFVTAAGDNPYGDKAGRQLGTGPTDIATYPCVWDLPNLVCVTSSTRNDDLAFGANFGVPVHLAAPGKEIWSSAGLSCGMKSGTSLAAPHVAGVAALLRSAFPNETVEQIVSRLLKGKAVPALHGKTKTGMRLDACSALGCPPP